MDFKAWNGSRKLPTIEIWAFHFLNYLFLERISSKFKWKTYSIVFDTAKTILFNPTYFFFFPFCRTVIEQMIT